MIWNGLRANDGPCGCDMVWLGVFWRIHVGLGVFWRIHVGSLCEVQSRGGRQSSSNEVQALGSFAPCKIRYIPEKDTVRKFVQHYWNIFKTGDLNLVLLALPWTRRDWYSPDLTVMVFVSKHVQAVQAPMPSGSADRMKLEGWKLNYWRWSRFKMILSGKDSIISYHSMKYV